MDESPLGVFVPVCHHHINSEATVVVNEVGHVVIAGTDAATGNHAIVEIADDKETLTRLMAYLQHLINDHVKKDKPTPVQEVEVDEHQIHEAPPHVH